MDTATMKMVTEITDRIRKHKLVTKADARKIPALRTTSELGDAATAWIKIFNPTGRETWFVTEFEPETGDAFGLVIGQETEIGYFNLYELGCARGKMGLPMERDKWFSPTTIGEIRNGRNN